MCKNLEGLLNCDLVCIVVTKIVLFLVCRRVRTPSVDAMTRDHRNDVLSNILAIAFGYIGKLELLGWFFACCKFCKKRRYYQTILICVCNFLRF